MAIRSAAAQAIVLADRSSGRSLSRKTSLLQDRSDGEAVKLHQLAPPVTRAFRLVSRACVEFARRAWFFTTPDVRSDLLFTMSDNRGVAGGPARHELVFADEMTTS